jgi:hypothetical protein
MSVCSTISLSSSLSLITIKFCLNVEKLSKFFFFFFFMSNSPNGRGKGRFELCFY